MGATQRPNKWPLKVKHSHTWTHHLRSPEVTAKVEWGPTIAHKFSNKSEIL